MPAKLLNRDARVVVVDASQPVRQAIGDSLRAYGLVEVTPVGSLQEAWALLENGVVDWLITPLGRDGPINALQVLQACSRERDLVDVRVSLVLTPDELYCLPAAFSMGLLSWHPHMGTVAQARSELSRLFATVARCRDDACLIAADYLWDWLATAGRPTEMVSLQNGLATVYRGSADVLLRLAEAHMRAGAGPAAASVLRGLEKISHDHGVRGAAQFERYLGRPLADARDAGILDTGSAPVVAGMDVAIVVDPDESARRAAKTALGDLGVRNIHEFGDGQTAYDWLSAQKATPHIAFVEWVLPKLTSLALLQRLAMTSHASMPVVVTSSQIADGDLPALRELGVAELVRKPATQSGLVAAMVAVAREEARPSRYYAARRQMLAALRRGESAVARAIRDRFEDDGVGSGAGAGHLLDAEAAYLEGLYDSAREHAIAALARGCDALAALSLIGKSLLKQRAFQVAAVFLEEAKAMAPSNVERLAQLAMSYAVGSEFERAQANLDAARRVDAASPVTREAGAAVALAAGDVEAAAAELAGIEASDDLTSFLNNRAVALAATGAAPESLELYRRALRAIPERRRDLLAIVRYNLALGHLRAGEVASAEAVLKDCHPSDPGMRSRVQALRSKVEAASAGRVKLRMLQPEERGADAAKAATPPRSFDWGTAFAVRKGDLGCFKLYAAPAADMKAVAHLLANPPAFVRRREQTHGSTASR